MKHEMMTQARLGELNLEEVKGWDNESFMFDIPVYKVKGRKIWVSQYDMVGALRTGYLVSNNMFMMAHTGTKGVSYRLIVAEILLDKVSFEMIIEEYED